MKQVRVYIFEFILHSVLINLITGSAPGSNLQLILVDNKNNDYYNYTQDEIDNNQIIQFNPNDIVSKPGKTCTYSNCPIFQGVCYEDNCICAYGYATLETSVEPLIHCNYKQKSRMVAFFLEFFFPFGIGHIYACKYVMAIIKFCLFCIFCCGICGELCCINIRMDKWIICSAFTIMAVFLFWMIFQLIDIICYAFGFYKDGNGIQMV